MIGELPQLFLSAIQQSVDELIEVVNKLGGVIYPAHINRQSYSILVSLGMIPKELPFLCLEVSQDQAIEDYAKDYPGYRILRSSDAHYLEQMCQDDQFIELDYLSMTCLFKTLKNVQSVEK